MEMEKIGEVIWRIPASGRMRTDGIIYASDKLMEMIENDNSPRQVANVATLPGIVGPSMAMPDIHWGYGFPIGGVAAFDESEGIVSPGGVGYDINCGVRMITTNLKADQVRGSLPEILGALFTAVPSGVGSRSRFLELSEAQMDRVIVEGAAAAVAMGYGTSQDLAFIESNGTIPGAGAAAVSRKARERGEGQLGTLGSGNHFLEIDRVEEIFEPGAAAAMDLRLDQIVISIHTGSRGLGHQVCDDALRTMQKASRKYGIELPDRQLSCAPLGSREADVYLAGMGAAANFAFANRQVITHLVREGLRKIFKPKGIELEDKVLYDVAHNIAKWERHTYEGRERKLLVHRKGATRAFGPGHPEIPQVYRAVGQPVLIPGDMGRASYILVGTRAAMESTFGSTCHGAGRVMSRQKAKSMASAGEVVRSLEQKGIFIKAASRETIVEEIPEAYKNVSDVVEVVRAAGIAVPVAKLKPLGVIKG
jgi:tRNA-splicing ligase RtcB